MDVDNINMHCSRCEYTGFRLIKREKVIITADLSTDEYVFTADCPKCNKTIVNKRPMCR